MKKLFGIQAEVNITTDDDIAKGIGKGFSKGGVMFQDTLQKLLPTIVKSLEKYLLEGKDKNSNQEGESHE